MVRANYPKRAMNLIEAPGDGTLDLQFHEDLKVGSYADLEMPAGATKNRSKAGNVSAATSKTMRDHITGTDGVV